MNSSLKTLDRSNRKPYFVRLNERPRDPLRTKSVEIENKREEKKEGDLIITV